jgi:hypothetical protein
MQHSSNLWNVLLFPCCPRESSGCTKFYVVNHIKLLLWRRTLCGADFDWRSSQAKFCRKAPHNLKRASSLILVLALVFRSCSTSTLTATSATASVSQDYTLVMRLTCFAALFSLCFGVTSASGQQGKGKPDTDGFRSRNLSLKGNSRRFSTSKIANTFLELPAGFTTMEFSRSLVAYSSLNWMKTGIRVRELGLSIRNSNLARQGVPLFAFTPILQRLCCKANGKVRGRTLTRTAWTTFPVTALTRTYLIEPRPTTLPRTSVFVGVTCF